MNLTKDITTGIKNLDEAKGIIEAYANVYGNEDFDGDISAPGSFRKTAQEARRKLRVLKNHDPRIDVGIPMEIDAEDAFGLRTVTKFNLDRPDAKDMFLMVKDRIENEQDADLSIGYSVVKRDEKDKRIIKEYKLFEYSFLTAWGANAMATATNVKSQKDLMAELIRLYNLPLSDPRLKEIEQQLKALESPYEPEPPTQKAFEPYTVGAFGLLLPTQNQN